MIEFEAIVVGVAASQERVPRLTVRYVIRSNGSPEALINPVRQALAAMDPQVGVRFVVLAAQIDESLLRERLMATLSSERTARRERQCDNCGHFIWGGQRYRRLSMTPHSELNAGDHWWTITVHIVCPKLP